MTEQIDKDTRESLIYEMVLANMRDGVVTFDLQGRIVTFNQAAGDILNIAPDEALGLTFAEVFLGEEAFDDFNEVVLKAIYEDEVTHSRDVVIWQGEESGDTGLQRRDLHVSSSFLHLDAGQDAERYGVIVVFSDVTEQRKRRKLKRLFGAYVDPRIVERILAGPAELEGGQEARMTVLFSDMRDFTGWSERLTPGALIALVNRFLAALTAPISEEAGITDKFIGDAIMAFWGPPFTDPQEQADACCRAVLGQRRCLLDLRAELEREGVPGAKTLDFSSGIATGPVFAGEIGPVDARSYTVLGDRVNVAARLQSAAKLYGVPIVVCEETWRKAGGAFRFLELDYAALKGRQKPERIFALLGPKDSGEDLDAEEARLDCYAAALEAYRAQDFSVAEATCRAWLEQSPEDRAVALLLSRSRHLQAHPPGSAWDGVFRE
ncbi:MAG: adenylate/guanylate cyclase domain-containing protein [Pseudomonadota bacterium]